MNDTGNRILIGVAVVLLIIGAWYLGTASKLIVSGGKEAGTSQTTSSQPSGGSGASDQPSMQVGGEGITVSGESIVVGDQPAGSYVMVTSVTLPEMGWVAVRDSNGRTLGAGRFDAGTHEAVQVPLLRNTETGQNYQALIYTDDGDKVFDLRKDTLLVNSDGSVAGTTFSALYGD